MANAASAGCARRGMRSRLLAARVPAIGPVQFLKIGQAVFGEFAAITISGRCQSSEITADFGTGFHVQIPAVSPYNARQNVSPSGILQRNKCSAAFPKTAVNSTKGVTTPFFEPIRKPIPAVSLSNTGFPTRPQAAADQRVDQRRTPHRLTALAGACEVDPCRHRLINRQAAFESEIPSRALLSTLHITIVASGILKQEIDVVVALPVSRAIAFTGPLRSIQ